MCAVVVAATTFAFAGAVEQLAFAGAAIQAYGSKLNFESFDD